MPKCNGLKNKKVGDCFYRNIWKVLKTGAMVNIVKDDFVLYCEIVKRKGDERYKLKVISRNEGIQV